MPQGSSSGKGKVLLFENRRYQEEDFVIPAQDTKGHSERLYFRCQPGHMRDLRVALASKKFPFRTVGDIGRVAIKLMVELLKGMEQMPSVSGQVDAIVQLVRDEEFHLEFLATYEHVTKGINRYLAAGEKGWARRLVVMIDGEIKKMPKGYWKDKYRKELKEKFGHLMKDAGAGLTEGQEDDSEDNE